MVVVLSQKAESNSGNWIVAPALVECLEKVPVLLKGMREVRDG